MNEIIVLTREQLQDVIREAVLLASEDLIKKIKSQKTFEIMTKSELAEYMRCDISKINRMMKGDLPDITFGSHPRIL